jgi:hypothetical protein
MKRIFLLFALFAASFAINAQVVVNEVSVKDGGSSYFNKQLSTWSYYQANTLITEVDFLKILGKDDEASMAAKYRTARDGKKALYWLSLIGMSLSLGVAGALVQQSNPLETAEESEKRMDVALPLVGIGLGCGLGCLIAWGDLSKKTDSYLTWDQAEAYARAYNSASAGEADPLSE